MSHRNRHVARARDVAGRALFCAVIGVALTSVSKTVAAADNAAGHSKYERYDRAPHDRAFDHGHTFTEHDDDLYSAAPPRKSAKSHKKSYKPPRYSDGYGQSSPPYGSLKDSPHQTYEAPVERYDRHRDYGHRYQLRDRYEAGPDWRSRQTCLPRRHIRRKLRRAGWRGFWRDFRRGRHDGHISYARARQRGTGDRYELAIDRCSGEVLSAEFIAGPNRRWHRRGVRFDAYRGDVVLRW